MAHVWHSSDATASDSSHSLYYHGRKFKEAYCRGEKIWDKSSSPLTIKRFLTGTSRISSTSVWNGRYDTFVSRVRIITDSRVELLYDYGLSTADASTQEVQVVQPSSEYQIFYHVVQTPEPYSIYNYPGTTYFRYSVYLWDGPNTTVHFDARFMSFPYSSGGQSGTYPGNPEDVTVWWTRTVG